jgi:hypothetical protein
MTQENKPTLADALSKQLLTKKYNRGEAIPIKELFANKQEQKQFPIIDNRK